MAPGDQGLERLVPGKGGPAAAGQQAEPVSRRNRSSRRAAISAGVRIPAVFHLYLLRMAGSVSVALYMPGANLLVPLLVPAEHLRTANSLWFMLFRISSIVGAPLAGVLLGLFGTAAAFVVITIMAVTASAGFALVSTPDVAAKQENNMWQEGLEGWRALRTNRPAWVLVLMGLAGSFVYSGILTTALPPLAKLTLQAGDRGIGLLMGAMGAGGIIGTALAGALPLRRLGLTMIATRLTGGIGVLLAGLASSAAAGMAPLVIVGLGNSIFTVAAFTVIQSHTPAKVRGRVMGIISMAVLGMNPLAFALAVFAGDWLGPRYLLVLGGALLLATGLWALTSRFFRNIK